jgi:hypothetical protein
MGTFTLALQAFEKSVDRRANITVRQIAQLVGASIVNRSPVGNPELWAVNQVQRRYNDEARAAGHGDRMSLTKPAGYVGGRFRANWMVGFDGEDKTTTEEISPDGQLSLDRLQTIPSDVIGHAIFITNSLPYAQPLEDGHSTQAPNGMVALTVMEFEPIVAEAVRNMKAAEENGNAG